MMLWRTVRQGTEEDSHKPRIRAASNNGVSLQAKNLAEVAPEVSADLAGLRYVSDEEPGLRRRKRGSGFEYLDERGRPVRDADTLARIRSLVIPPAWTEVWICRDPRGHLQATGRDARGRKQHRYHPRFREVREQTKYEKMTKFAQALPRIRRRVARDLARHGLPRDKVLAAVVRLLETTLIRVGNDEYARDNGHYGLTTIRNHHVRVRGRHIRFEFRGKSGVEHEVDLEDPRLARIVSRCQDLPGQELFGYVDDDGRVCDVTSDDVNEYLRRIGGQEFTAKDFRTWAGTVLAAEALREVESVPSATAPARTKSAAKATNRKLVRAIDAVAERLGNTRAVCRRCYVHPAILEGYSTGTLLPALKAEARQAAATPGALAGAEAAVLAFLQTHGAGDGRRRN